MPTEINITPPREVPDLMVVRESKSYYALHCVSTLTCEELASEHPTRIAWTGEIASNLERYAKFYCISDAVYFAGLHGYRVLGSRGAV